MRKLLEFIISKRHWFLFVLLEVICFVLIARNSTYQRNVLISTTNIVTRNIASLTGNISGFLNMGKQNRELAERNGELEMQVLQLQNELNRLHSLDIPFTGFLPDSGGTFPYKFVMAQVKNSSVTQLANTITIDKGKKDGIAPEMGVVSESGVIGVVSLVSDNYAIVLPLLNPKLRLSSKLKGTNNHGSLVWNGRDAKYAQLEEIPRHADFQKGDTIVTSGFSAIFPAGIMVGTVADYRRQHDDNFLTLDIELSTNFQALDHVRVLMNDEQAEQRMLEKEVNRGK